MMCSTPRGFVLSCFGLCVLFVVDVTISPVARAQSRPSAQWEELTAADFAQAIHQAQGTCILPFGIIEKHGAQLPLGTDLFDIRYVSVHAAEQEYAVIFPAYYFGQIFEARHEPGTLAYSAPGIRRGSKTPQQPARHALHGDLVVCAFSESLRRGRVLRE